MYNLASLDRNLWPENKRQLFIACGASKSQAKALAVQTTFFQDHKGKITTVEVSRPLSYLPKWLKSRIKFRLRSSQNHWGYWKVTDFGQIVTNALE
jgi:hypothetical protein